MADSKNMGNAETAAKEIKMHRFTVTFTNAAGETGTHTFPAASAGAARAFAMARFAFGGEVHSVEQE